MSETARSGGVLAGLVTLLAGAGTDVASAHVDYVVDSEDAVDAAVFLAETLSTPLHALLVVGTAAAVGAGAVAYLERRPLREDVTAVRVAMADYTDLVPWLLRIGVGFPLVGAGFSGYFISPAVPADLRLLQVTLGFLLLFGLATRAAALTGLTAYLVGLSQAPELLLAGEFVAGFLAIALVGPGRPSADDVLARVATSEDTLYGQLDPVSGLADRVNDVLDPSRRFVPTVVRVGLGLQFVFLGITQKLADPGPALAVVARYDLTSVVPVDPALWVLGAGLAETAVGIALLVGLFTRAAGGAAFGLFTTTLFGLPDDPVLAHLSMFALVSAVLITGAGPLSLDARLHDEPATNGTDSTAETTPTAPTSDD
jgi:uncharacterized membrane protein YphA (DoxX/SURF4 family)